MMDKLEGISPGDRVRVTFEGVVSRDRPVCVKMDGSEGQAWSWWATKPEVAAPTFKIERIEPPLAVGDRVRHERRQGEVMATFEGRAWVMLHSGAHYVPDFSTIRISDLERIP